MSQTVDEDVIFDDVYELCEVIGRSAETTAITIATCSWCCSYWYHL